MKKIRIRFRTPSLKKSFDDLPKEDILKKRIERFIGEIKRNPFRAGQPIAKEKIPKEYLKEGFDNAFWVDLSKEWRLIYSLRRGLTEIEILCIVLDWFESHKTYAKKFKYST